MNRFTNFIHACLVLLCLVLASHLKDPHLLPWRAYETPVLMLVALSGMFLALYSSRSRARQQLFFLMAWLMVLSMVSFGDYEFLSQKQTVLKATPDTMHRLSALGQHLVVGYNNSDDVRELVQRGYVAGLFLTRRNSRGKSLEQLRSEIDAFQNLRREAGLSPLIIASDQEGGSVSRLSPPLPQLPALSALLGPGLSTTQIENKAKAYGVEQALALADLGVNINFSPVLDLKPSHESGVLDFHTRISERAIAADPDTVARVGLAYSQGLLAKGVLPTLKHFPGLGEVTEDTHHFSARLELSLEKLNDSDWYPFRLILSEVPALLMIGHVIVNDVDAEYPASLSHKIITNILRENWNHDGVLISDDMTMAAVYNRGLCPASIRSLNAGMDLLLLAYDWGKIYRVMDCLLRADKSGKLEGLEQSRLRLSRLSRHLQQLSASE